MLLPKTRTSVCAPQEKSLSLRRQTKFLVIMNSLLLGDVVYLKSDTVTGYCAMTVSKIYHDNETVQCMWFNKTTNSFAQGDFPIETLKKV